MYKSILILHRGFPSQQEIINVSPYTVSPSIVFQTNDDDDDGYNGRKLEEN